ncbi:hypothetical protein [Streptomyces sp. NPDC059761]|uniref:hypothetical protein n=1 Tax=Streptomyces sp. NPDC059761 TaxID=3346937 RepID=UPI003654BBA9
MARTAEKPLTPRQQAAVDHMRAHDGKVSSGEGFTATTMHVLEQRGLCTLKTWMGIASLHGGKLYDSWAATLTDDGWGDHPRPQAEQFTSGDTITHAMLGGEWDVIETNVKIGFPSPSGTTYYDDGIKARNRATGREFTARPQAWTSTIPDTAHEEHDSMTDSPTPAELARQLADLAVALERAVRESGPGWETPEDVAAVIDSASTAFGYLPAVLTHSMRLTNKLRRKTGPLADADPHQLKLVDVYATETAAALDTASRTWSALNGHLLEVAPYED